VSVERRRCEAAGSRRESGLTKRRRITLPRKDPRAIACQILRSLERPGVRLNHELASRGAALEDKRDLRLATELVYGTLRHLSELDYHVERLSGLSLGRIQADLLPPLRIGLYQLLYLSRIRPSAAVYESVRLASFIAGPRPAGFVNAVLRRAAEKRYLLKLPPENHDRVAGLSLRHSVPYWIVSRWLERLGDPDTCALLETFGLPSPLTLWVNPLRGVPEHLVDELATEGIQSELSQRLPGSLRILRGNPARSRAFLEGKGYLQDEASQIIPRLLDARPGETVLDLCAAPGGKSFALACAVGPYGVVVAADRSLRRLKKLQSNCDRLQIPWVLLLAADFERTAPFVLRFSGVLLDAPCTGTGTLGRHPELRWRLRPADLSSLVRRQRTLLETAAGLVGPGGRILYSVCSLEAEEGEEQIEALLKVHPEFRVGDLHPLVPALLADAVTSEGYFRTWPHRHGMDGFFAARLERSG